MKLNRLKAVNLEETISRKDELMMTWSLTAFDSQNRLVGVASSAWGVEKVKKGAVLSFENQAPVQLAIPKGGKVVASLLLIEVDDYTQAQQFIKRIRDVNGWIQVPVGLFEIGSELLTPLKYVTTALTAAGLGIQLTDRLDKDDILGQSSVEVKDSSKDPKKKSRWSTFPPGFREGTCAIRLNTKLSTIFS
ncbi:hypothetical protein [Larkinella rosea]|uniref:Uncharacterized protein n=1 Tax=Larkinella rosea TaxID=2025312 RepID=A0A3P1BZP3_9BACT|nr:hypothetical protein [Larkinella rosea]RRB06472.1 hypothetical protein EHT25_01330 [Larkinella rosea]